MAQTMVNFRMDAKIWSDEAWEEYTYWQTQDKKTLKKINRLIQSIDRNGVSASIILHVTESSAGIDEWS